MKKLALIVFAALAFMGQNAFAQNSRFGHGKDSADCVLYLSYYQEYYKQKIMTLPCLAGSKLIPFAPLRHPRICSFTVPPL